jgi:hypothetical protein
VLEALQNTAFSQWLLVSEWAYPILLTLHSLGLAMLVGVLIIIDLRILGLARSIPLLPIKRLMSIVWLAFAVNAVSGTMLFAADAVKFAHSPTFQLKLTSIVIGVVLAALMSKSVLDPNAAFEQAEAAGPAAITWKSPVVAKALAALSIVIWIAAIGLGRYMAYE